MTGVLNVKLPLLLIDRSFPALFCNTRPLPDRPLTVPPTVKVPVTQVTATVVTLAPATVPLPLETLQVWLGLPGWVLTLTA